jgi:GNAT superfamily N-acetyltransferase
MPVNIRLADLEVDRPLFTVLLSRNLSPSAGGARFDWLYLQNPHGLARAWVAIEENTGKGIGAAAAFPRKLCIEGSICLGYVLGDFCIDPQYRSLGLALQLQRACLEHVGSTSSTLGYDFPSNQMMAIYRRMQIVPTGQMARWSKPLRAERKIGKLVKSVRLARTLAVPINKFLEWKDITSVSNRGWSIAEHQGDCTEEFTRLTRAVGSHYGIFVERSAQYLNWRYLRHPLVHYEILTARRGEALMGYVIFSRTNEDANIVDLFGFGNAEMWAALVGHVVAHLHAHGIITVSLPALATNPWTGLLKKWGFHQREGSPLVVHASQKMKASSENPKFPWFLTDGDRES